MTEDKIQLRVLIANQREARLDEIAGVVDSLGHTVVARVLDVSRIADETRRERILMERHGITADDAFAELRTQARSTNTTVVEVAEAATLSHPLFKARPHTDDS